MKTISFFILMLLSISAYAQESDKVPLKSITIDIPLSSDMTSVDWARIQDNSIGAGSALKPWKKSLNYNYLPMPKVGFATEYMSVVFEPRYSQTLDEGVTRKNRNLEISAEGGKWFLIGFDVFGNDEKIYSVPREYDFYSDFQRWSYGLSSWGGLKVGDFRKSYLTVKYGRGNVKTAGKEIYQIPHAILLGVFDEDFKTELIAGEFKVRWRFINPGFKFEQVRYKRVFLSPNPVLYGYNDFKDSQLQGSLEVIPLPRYDTFGFVVNYNRYFGSRDSLLFQDDPPAVQIYFRIAF